MKVFTLGTAGRQHYDFTKILNKYGIQVVIDVRRSPSSPQYPQFNRDSLQMLCASQGADYIFLGSDLGANLNHEVRPEKGTGQGFEDSRSQGSRSQSGSLGPSAPRPLESFNPDPALRDWLASPEYARSISIIAAKAEKRATCVLCSEMLPDDCQRLFLARSLAAKGFEIAHIMNETRLWNPPPEDTRVRHRHRSPRRYQGSGGRGPESGTGGQSGRQPPTTSR